MHTSVGRISGHYSHDGGAVRRSDFLWSDEEIARLKRRRADGLSFGRIAHEMGLTRNAVIGKAQRLGMSRPHVPANALGPIAGASIKRARARGKPMKPLPEIPPPTQAVDLPPEASPHAVTLWDLREHSCRWPIADHPWLFCGAAQRDGYPYCGRHAALAYKRAPERTTVPLVWRAA